SEPRDSEMRMSSATRCPKISCNDPMGRDYPQLLLIEIVVVQSFDNNPCVRRNTDVVLDHEVDKLRAVDEDYAFFDAADIAPRVLAERGGCQQDSFSRPCSV